MTNLPLSENADKNRAKLVQLLSKACGVRGMCLGQSLDLHATDKDIPIAELIEIHALKTGALLSVSAEMACYLDIPVKSDDRDTIIEYANHIGLAFQIRDDILDVISNTETLGKPQGSDTAANKSTFVAHYGLEGAKIELDKVYESALSCIDRLPFETNELKTLTDYIVSRDF